MNKQPCYCPPGADVRCSPDDETHDIHGRELCCPYDNRAMAEFYGWEYTPGWEATPGIRAAMRKRRQAFGRLEEIAQKAADNR
jgi:hypothetical protein